jgi:outer membrane receptor protein involved in Fe transport
VCSSDLTAAAAGAAKPAEQPSAANTQSLDDIIVTSTAIGVKKLDASYSVTAVDLEQIKEANPKSTADLLKISPGIWPESTGGQTGANIEIAGFPGGGDAPYFTMQMMGSPLYGMPTLSFFEQTSIFRLDDTVERAEIVQGGPSVVYGDGQMGATANFILRRGTANAAGSLGLTYGSEHLERLDAFYGFPIADRWYASVGGFYRTSNGVRDPGFKADKGGQLTATLTHDLDNGSIMLYARVLNDKNQFITPIPLIQHGADQFSAYPGFDPLKSTYYSPAIQHVFLPSYPGGGTNADLANGRGADVQFFGGNLDLELGGGFTLADKLLIDGGDVDTNALFSGNNPAALQDELYNTPGSAGGFTFPAGSVATATYVGGGAVDPNQSVIHQGWWFIHKHLFNINNDLRLSKQLFDGNTLTAGIYVAHYTDDDKWSLGNQMLMTNTPNARPIVVSYLFNGQTYQRTDNQGFSDFGGFHITEHGTATNEAFYLSDSWRINQWLFDASARVENEKATNHVCNLTNKDLDGDPLTLYNNSVPVCNGTVATTDYNPTHVSWTVGANYEFASNMSVYARGNRGAHFLDFDNGIRGSKTGHTPPLTTIENIEVGFKYQAKWIYADIGAYHKIFSGLLYTPSDNHGAPLPGGQLQYGSDSKGINALLAITPVDNLKIQLIGNYLDGHYSHYSACVSYTDINGNPACAFFDGKQLQRQPKLHFALTPSYKLPMEWGDVSAFVTYTHVGAHTQDQSGLQQLGTYHTFDFGVVANIGPSWELRVQGSNVTNELGLTESNSRILGSASGAGGVILARPLEGREINGQVRYKF